MKAGARYVERAAGERAMRFALASVIVFLAVSEGMGWQLSMGYGLSVKNALLYLIAVALIAKSVVQQNFHLEVGEIHSCFATLIGYAILAMVAAAFVFDYAGYRPIASGIALKSRLIDNLIFFVVFFYGLRERANAHAVIRFLLFAALFANSLAVLDAFGVVQFANLEQREDGRVQGVIGESNVYAAFVALLLPGQFAAGIMASGVRRIFWFVGALVSSIALLLTVSRGAYVGMVVAAIWSAALLRRHISLGRIVAWGGASFVILLVLITVVSARYGDLLTERLATIGDAETVSSGRTAIWMHALGRMAEAPISFITGYGWYAYESMPFMRAPHNHYLWLWFNLGLVGLACGVLLFALVVRRALAAISYLPRAERPAMIAFVIGSLAYAVATFFVDLYSSWVWYWAYAGLVMRIAVSAQPAVRHGSAQPAIAAQTPVKRDPFGWVGSAQ